VLRRAAVVLVVFLRLGVTSFGGPVAHLGYFRAEFVERRGWLSERDYADLVALCQFLPGPASSQVGFAIGLRRAGVLGAIAAFLAFTMPSAVLLVAIALGARLLDAPVASAVLAGLKVVAVAIVAQAVWGMARTLTPDARRAGIAVVAALLVLLLPGSVWQAVAIAVGVLAGLWLCRTDGGGPQEERSRSQEPTGLPRPVPRWAGIVAAAAFVLLVAGLPTWVALGAPSIVQVADAFTRSGALVFGGGHVVLPLLETEIVGRGWVGHDAFLTGYGAAQAMPGPLFAFAGYLGALLTTTPNGIAGAALAIGSIFLPGFLLLTAVLPYWDRVRAVPGVQAGMRGANAAVVGILGAALYSPVFVGGITGVPQFSLGLVCFALLVGMRLPSWAVVLVGAAGGIVIAAATGGL